MRDSVRRFACTQCGKCCNRSPEVELSEAAALADVFVFRLMFRLYRMANVFDRATSGSSETFYQKKRLLSAHAAHKYATKIVRAGKSVECTNYLMISALAMDTSPGACAALTAGRCGIHDRRPLGCQTVPFHYSRAEGLAASDFDSFVETPDYRCDTSEAAPLFWKDGRIVDGDTLQARADALALAETDRPWKEAIVRLMKRRHSGNEDLPTVQEVEANAGFAAMTATMRIGWEIAAEAGMLSRQAYRVLIEKQLATIERELVGGDSAVPERQTLGEMSVEYRQVLVGSERPTSIRAAL